MKFSINWVILILFLGVLTLFVVADFSYSSQEAEEIGFFIIILLLIYFTFGYTPSDKEKKYERSQKPANPFKEDKTPKPEKKPKPEKAVKLKHLPQERISKPRVRKSRFDSEFDDR